MNAIPFLRPRLVTKESLEPYIESIDQTNIYSNFGPLNSLFESRIVEECFGGIGAATTVANATLGLITAIRHSKRTAGRYAVMPSFTFAATPLAAIWCGLDPFFVDIRRDDFCMDESLLRAALEELGDDVAVVMPYAAFGTNLDLEPYKKLHQDGVPVVVDAAASFGASGPSGQFGTGFPGPVIFSFHATKAFGIGEGGLVYSGSPGLVDGVRRASNFGFSDQRECIADGLNAKLSEYAAAVGLATLDVFPRKIRVRRRIYETYVERMNARGMLDKGWQLQNISGSVAHQFMTVLCPEGHTGADYVSRLDEMHIDARTYFSPACHQQERFRDFRQTSMSVSDSVASRVLSLPLWEGMEPADVDRVVTGIAG